MKVRCIEDACTHMRNLHFTILRMVIITALYSLYSKYPFLLRKPNLEVVHFAFFHFFHFKVKVSPNLFIFWVSYYLFKIFIINIFLIYLLLIMSFIRLSYTVESSDSIWLSHVDESVIHDSEIRPMSMWLHNFTK